MPHQDIIRLKNASFYAYHGVATDEQNLGGKFEVDVELQGNLAAAKESDNLKQTVDYEAVYALVGKSVTSKKFYLLETLAHSIAHQLLAAYKQIDVVTVRVRKPHPPVKGVIDYVEIEVTEHQK